MDEANRSRRRIEIENRIADITIRIEIAGKENQRLADEGKPQNDLTPLDNELEALRAKIKQLEEKL